MSEMSANHWVEEGNTLAEQDRHEEAVMAYEQALLLDSTDPIASLNMLKRAFQTAFGSRKRPEEDR